jgi:spermidine/putrescine transport system substrate-binding protein
MNRRTFLERASRAALIGVAGVVDASCGRSAPRLNVYNWSDYVAPQTIPNFEREFGVRVRYGTYESTQEMLAKVMAGNSGWDVVFPSEEFIPPMIAMELFQPLQHGRLPNLDSLDPQFQRPPWDPELRYSVPYMHGTTGIVYQRAVFQQAGVREPHAWADLWDARLRGKITMLDDGGEVFSACLKKAGYSVNSRDPEELRAAAREAVAQKPLLRAYLNAEVRDQLVAGDVAAAQAWAVTAGQAMAAAGGRLAFAFPAEGFPRYCDTVAILRESRRSPLAHQFINYLLRPGVAAEIVAATQTATANGAALKLLPSQIRQNPVLYPRAEVLARGEWAEAGTAASQKLRDRLWTEIKSS